MSSSQARADRRQQAARFNIDPEVIPLLMDDLSSHDGLVRLHAREQLVSLGREAVDPLIEAIGDHRGQVRWEAAKALAEIGHPAAAGALVKALEDERAGVRWVAARGLTALKREGLKPLLRALMERSDSVWLRQGAHYVLRCLAEQGFHEVVAPVLAALEGRQPTLEVPQAAFAALQSLKAAA